MLSLYALHDRFVVQSEDHQKQYLQIDRQTANVQVVNESFQSGIHAGATCQQSFGIVGIIQLLSGKYLIHISNAEIVADLLGSAIYSVISAEVIPFSIRPLQDDLPDEVAKAEEEVYLDMIRSTLINSRFHFSYLHDLTNTIQRIAADTPSGPSAQHQELLPDLISIADRRFFWNYHLLSELISVSISPWAVVLVSGFFQCFHLSINSIDFKYGLLSRRSCLNAGKRFTRRGLDEQGHPTNFAEQEQVIWYEAEDGHLQVSSFVQTRGSVPLLWSQEACMKWSPPLRIDLKPQSISLLEQHLAEHARIYGRTILLNLVNQSGKEANIVSALSANVPAYCPGSNHSYSLVSFDFHQVCRNMKYENIQVLLNQVRDDLQKMSFFYGIRHSSNRTWTVKQTQSGCFRTNCMDCLDRTNVVQSAIAKSILAAQLRDCKICHEEDIEKFPPLYSRFREIWADNADAMSRLYSGTDALKTDYTRSGRRSALGALNDGKNSILRFFLNNFRDGYCQDSLDLFLGNYQVDLSAKSSNLPYARSRNNQDGFSQLFNFIVSRSFLIFLSTLVLTVALPEHSRPSVSNAAAFSILFGPIISLALAQGNLRQFVDKPKFVRAPGLSSSHQGDDASLKSSLLKSD